MARKVSAPKASGPKGSRSTASTAPVSGRPCPICSKPPAAEYSPFCSKRCADVDLHRWLGGVYAVPTEEQPGDGEMPPPDRDER